MMKAKIAYYTEIADNAMILSHRLAENSSKGPFLEEDLACSNVALDLLGMAESIYEEAAKLKADGSIDSTAYGTGTVTSVTGTAPVVSSGGTTPAISMAAATTSVNGYLTSTDWNTFNNKQSALTNPVTGTGTSGRLAYWNGTSTQTSSGNLTWDNTANILAATNIAGNGALLTALNADNITTGTLPIARGGTGSSTLTADIIEQGTVKRFIENDTKNSNLIFSTIFHNYGSSTFCFSFMVNS